MKLLMPNIEFKKSDVIKFQYLSYKYPHPYVQRKSNVLLLVNSRINTTTITNTNLVPVIQII